MKGQVDRSKNDYSQVNMTKLVDKKIANCFINNLKTYCNWLIRLKKFNTCIGNVFLIFYIFFKNCIGNPGPKCSCVCEFNNGELF